MSDKDPILRRSGMYTLAMAYCGTGHNQAIRKLLHVAVRYKKMFYLGNKFNVLCKAKKLKVLMAKVFALFEDYNVSLWTKDSLAYKI